jgi:hypothetical protein
MWAFIVLLFLPTLAMASGTVTGTLNASRVVHEGTEGALPVREGDSVARSDTYQTDPASKLRFLLDGGTIFTLGEKTEFQIVEEGGAELQPHRLTGSLSAGIVRALVGFDASEGSRFAIETPTASVVAGESGTYFITWLTECDGKPATGILALDGQVVVFPKGGADGVKLSASFYTKIGDACPPPLPKAVSREVMAEVTAATEMTDPVRSVAMEIDEPIAPESGRAPMEIRLLPPIAQTPNLSALTRVRVHVVFP